MELYDVVIVGGGFAGLAAAKLAARAGLRTLVLDRQPEAGAVVHTTGLLVQEAVERLQPPVSLTRRIEGARLYAPNLAHRDLDAPGYGIHATDTRAVLRWMADTAAAAGAELRWSSPFHDAYRRGDHVVLPEQGVRARWLIGADGARSRVARSFGLSANTEFLLGIEAECCGLAPDVDRLHCFVDSQIAPGYIGWLFTGVRGIAQLGLAARLPAQPDLDALVAHIRSRFDFRLAVRVERRGGLIPVGGPVRRWHAPGVVLVGDAAGLVSPLTAGGIHLALASGEHAARAIADHLLRGAPDPAVVLAHTRPAFAMKRWLRAAMDLRPPNALLDAALLSPAAGVVAREILFHHLRRRSAKGHRLSVVTGG